MGRPKLPPEEAKRRKRESNLKSRNRPEAKERRREYERKRKANKRAEAQGKNISAEQIQLRHKYLEWKKKCRSDPVKYQRELVLQKERRARKRLQSLMDNSTKRLCLDNKLQDTMGRPKLPPEEAKRRKRESNLKSRNRPEAKERRREYERKRKANKRAEAQGKNFSAEQIQQRHKYLEWKKKCRSDPVKYQRE